MPPNLLSLLTEETLCSLATCQDDQPHVSLMNFTYVPTERILVLSSRRNTTKVAYLQKNPRVALLIARTGDGPEDSVSCTFHGWAQVVEPGLDEPYRQLHKTKHRTMDTFITGEDIAIISIRLDHAVLADTRDQVRTWQFRS